MAKQKAIHSSNRLYIKLRLKITLRCQILGKKPNIQAAISIEYHIKMQELARIISQTGAETKLFDLLEQEVQDKVGAKLVTLMWLDFEAGRARRIYTNRPDLYPTNDSKPISNNPWHEHVIINQNTFVANSLDEMDEQFTDKDFFSAHGCASVLNMPIAINGKTVGSLNLLHEENHFTEERIEKTQELALTAMVCIMLQQSNLSKT